MKNAVKYILQKILGFQNYLFLFSRFKILTLRNDSNEKDFFHFLSLLNDGKGAVLDIGANIGIMTYHLSKSLPNCQIYAIEPMPDNFKILSKIILKYNLKNVYAIDKAVGEEKGTLKMVMPNNGKTKMQGLSHVIHDSIPDWNEGEKFDVLVETLDNLFIESPIQGIKIDVENFEYFALKGGENIIKKYNPIIYAELWDNQNRVRCFDLLKSLSYQVFVIENCKLVLFDSKKHTSQNFIFKISN